MTDQEIVDAQGPALWKQIVKALKVGVADCENRRSVTLTFQWLEDVDEPYVLLDARASGNLYGLSVRFKPGRGIQCDPTHEGNFFIYKFAVLRGQITVLGLNGELLIRPSIEDGEVICMEVAEALAHDIIVERILKNRYV